MSRKRKAKKLKADVRVEYNAVGFFRVVEWDGYRRVRESDWMPSYDRARALVREWGAA